MTIRTIVAATDFSFAAHRAARRAGFLARDHAAALQLLHVLDATSARRWRRDAASVEALRTRILADADAGLTSLAEDVMADSGVTGARIIREGDVSKEVIAAGAGADLLVLGPRGVNPLRDFILGSTAERIVRRILRPLLLARQDAAIAYDHVLVPVDFSDHSPPSLAFARTLAPHATLHVYHAFDCPMEGYLRTAGTSAEAIEAYCRSVEEEANDAMQALLGRSSDAAIVKRVERGDARLLIPQRADDLGCTLIVMGRQGRSWLAEQVLGGVTRFVLEHARVDVAIVPVP